MKTKKTMRMKRKKRIRARISGTILRPRLCVFRSNRRAYAQIVDDTKGHTIIRVQIDGTTVKDWTKLGETMLMEAKKKHISSIVFDRCGYKYHGTIAAFAEVLRKGGLLQ